MQYFIKTPGEISGPYTKAQIKSGVKSGKLKDSHLISNSKNGPWIPLGQALGESAEPSTPEKGGIGDEEIETWLGNVEEHSSPQASMPVVQEQFKMPEIDAGGSAPVQPASSVEVTAKDNESDLSGSDSIGPVGRILAALASPSRVETTAPQKVKEERSNAVDNRPFDRTIKDISAGDGVVIDAFKLVNGSKEYSYYDPDYPALSACLTYISLFAKLYFLLGAGCLLVTGSIGSMSGNVDSIRIFASLVDAPFLEFATGDDLELELSILRVLWEMIFHALRFVLIMGGCEVARLLTRIEKNTR